MKLGNAAWGFRETPLEEQLKITKEMGLTVLELGIANAPNDLSQNASKEEIENVKFLYNKYGIDLICAATGNDFSIGKSDDVEKIKKVVDICEKLGVKMLRIFAGFSPLAEVTGESWNHMISSLNDVADYSKKVNLVIETHGGVKGFEDGVEHFHSVTTNIATLGKIINSLPDYVKICYDPANLYAVGNKEPEKFYNIFKERIGYAHFKDFKLLDSGHLRPSYCGASDMDWKVILEVMKDYDGIAFLEYENPEDVEIGLKKSLEYIKCMKNSINFN